MILKYAKITQVNYNQALVKVFLDSLHKSSESKEFLAISNHDAKEVGVRKL